jgi:hypothetical protein
LIKNYFESQSFIPQKTCPFDLKDSCFNIEVPFKNEKFLSQYLVFINKKKNEFKNSQQNLVIINKESKTSPKILKTPPYSKKNFLFQTKKTPNNIIKNKKEIALNFSHEKEEEKVNQQKDNKVKIILGVSGSGKSHHILNKIYENNKNYLIYLSCGDVYYGENSNEQIIDQCTKFFIKDLETNFWPLLYNYEKNNKTNKKNEVETRNIMKKYIFYYFYI